MSQTSNYIKRRIKPLAKVLSILLIIGIAIWEYIKLLKCKCLEKINNDSSTRQ